VNLYAELESIVETLERNKVPFAVCGGIAVTLHGHVRATKDIDLLVPEEEVARAKAAIGLAGYSLPALPMTFDAGAEQERTVHRVSKIVGEESMTVDLIVLGTPMRSVWESRLVLDWKGRQLPVVSRDGLARMKRLAGRLQDLADLENLGIRDE
jgi:hypothetical protein